MNHEELRRFLSDPRLAKVATLKKDGSPHITPVWFDFDGTHLYLSSSPKTTKVKNIQRDNRVAVTIANEDGSKVAIFEGTAEVSEDKGRAKAIAFTKRYLPADQVDAFLKQPMMAEPRVVVTVRPRKTISWDYSKLGGAR